MISEAIVEARVLQVVETIRSTGKNEDDLVECKSDWPLSPKKWARQLAALANQAAGENVLVLIGVQEVLGDPLAVASPVELSTFWSQVESVFDQGDAPELVRNLVVTVEEGRTVVALLIGTGRVPYVVKVPDSQLLEVPIRQGTRTVSAHRRDLLRLLLPTTRIPSMTVLAAEAVAGYHPSVEPTSALDAGRNESSNLTVILDVYLEHVADAAAFLPRHLMSAKASPLEGSGSLPLEVDSSLHASSPVSEPLYGVHQRVDGIRCSASGTAYLRCYWQSPSNEVAELDMRGWAVELTFGVAGTSRIATARTTVNRVEIPTPVYYRDGQWGAQWNSKSAS